MHTHARTPAFLSLSFSLSLSFLSLSFSLDPSSGNFAAYDSRDPLHSVFSVNDCAYGPIPRKDSEKEREMMQEQRRKKERKGGGAGSEHHFEHGAVRVPWPLSGPKLGLKLRG